MALTCKDCPLSTLGCADDDFITSAALHDARGHTSRVYSSVAVDAKSIVPGQKQKKVSKHVHLLSKQFFFIFIFDDKMVDIKLFFCWGD